MTRALALVVVALGVSACKTASKAPEFQPVSQEDVGRLSPQQMAPMAAARQDVDLARDELARAKHRLGQANRERGYAEAEQTAAKAELQRAEALRKSADASREPQRLAAAEEAAASAQLQQRAYEARHDFTVKLIAAREAEVRASEAKVAEMEARFEAAKLAALQQAGIPAATKYDPARFQQRVAEAVGSSQEAQNELAKAMGAVQQSETQWRTLREQVRVREQGAASGGR